MASSVLVTLADENYLEAARQLFACVHFDAGWSGDLLLLAHEVPEAGVAPFRERGILVHPVEQWRRDRPSPYHAPAVLSKLALFTPFFRRWRNVLYLDGDMMFWASLERLARVRGLHAISDRSDLAWQFRREGPAEARADLARRYDLGREAFNTGLLAFSSDVIRDDTHAVLQELYERYEGLHANADQGVVNLYFQGRWKRLPDFYAALRHVPARHFRVPKGEFRTIGRHFVGAPRVWEPANPWHEEWRRSLARFEHLDARAKQPPARAWSGWEIRRYWWWLHLNRAARRAFAPVEPSWRALRRSRPGRLSQRVLQRLRAVLGGSGPPA
jgi:lipopolysaccharide biosynthesis glycosyltransferase